MLKKSYSSSIEIENHKIFPDLFTNIPDHGGLNYTKIVF